jgi:PleD family two-component response regulator
MTSELIELMTVTQPKTILIADNNETLLTLLKCHLYLVEPNAEVLLAQDGFNAMAQLQTTSIELFILGEQLPGVKSFVLAQTARRLWPQIQIIWLTSQEIAKVMAQAKRKQVILDACFNKAALLLYLLESESREAASKDKGLQSILQLSELGVDHSYE